MKTVKNNTVRWIATVLCCLFAVSVVRTYAEQPLNGAAQQKLFQARKALAMRDVSFAEARVAEVQAMNLQFQQNEDRPELVARLIAQYKHVFELGKSVGSTDEFRRQYALLMVYQADSMLRRGELNLAQQLAQEAANQQVIFNQAEKDAGLEPNVLMKRIADAKMTASAGNGRRTIPAEQLSAAAQAQLGKSLAVLRQCRQAMDAGQFEQAEALCNAAREYRLPETVYPLGGDSPDRLAAEIVSRKTNRGNTTGILQTGAAIPMPRPTLAPEVNPPQRNPALVDKTIRQREAVVSQISSEIMQQLSDAQRLSQEQHKPEAALDILQAAKTKVQAANIDNETKTIFIRQIDKVIENTVAFMDNYKSQARQDQINKQVLAERKQEAIDFQKKEEKLQALFKECNKLIDEQRYDDAVMLAKKAKELAPDESATHLLVTSTQLAYNATQSMNTRDKKADGFLQAMMGVDNASIMPNFDKSPLHYATNWSDLTKNRQSYSFNNEYQRPESEKKIIRSLEMPVSVRPDQAKTMTLEQALRHVCGQAGVPLYLDEAALKEAEILSDMVIKMPLEATDIKLKSALNIILNQHDLAYVVDNEMLTITNKKRAKGKKYHKGYYVGDLLMNAPQPSIPDPNLNPFENAFRNGWNIQNIQKPNTPQTNSAAPVNNNEWTSANSGLTNFTPVSARNNYPDVLGQNYGTGRGSRGTTSTGTGSTGINNGNGLGGSGGADMDSIIDLIQKIVLEPLNEENGIGGAEMPEPEPFGVDKLVVVATEEVHQKIEDLLTQLRKMNDLQIAIEVRYITLSDSFFEIMGLDFDMSFRNDKAAGKLKTTTVVAPDGTESTYTSGNKVVVGLAAPNTATVNGAVQMFQNNFDVGLTPMFGNAQPQLGLQTGFALLSDIEAYFFLAAAQGDERSSVLTAPKIMVYNGHTGSVNDSSTTPYVTSVTPVVGDFSVGYQPIISLLTQGQQLTIQATVSNDRQHVRMTLQPSFTIITRENLFTYNGENEGTEETEDTTLTALGDDVAAIGTGSNKADERTAKKKKTSKRTAGITLQQPTVSNFSVMATVNCPDGGTAVLGGIKRLSEGRREGGTPILNKIPYIQRLFSNTSIGRDTKTMMVMVTPRIIIQEEEEEIIMGSKSKP